MDASGVASLIGAIAKLVGALSWPAVAGLVLTLFRPDLSRLLERFNRVVVNAGGGTVTLEARTAEAAALVAGAVAIGPDAPRAPDGLARTASRAVGAVGGLNAAALERIGRSSVLWVDDRPQNNILERRALEVLGAGVTTALTTEEALGRLAATRYRLVISDMGRPPDQRAGYTLLDAMRARGDATPVVFYAGSATQEQRAEAEAHGASGQASNAARLFELVVPLLHG